MKIKHGDLFTTDLTFIGHGVNTVGVMGAGVAKTVRDKFPKTYETYRQDCRTGLLKPGTASIGYPENGHVIFNIASQQFPGPNATYPLLAQAVEFAVESMVDFNVHTMALPQIGCGIGGLEWEGVEQILLALENDYDFEFEVWIYG